jgi:hypothetical protein
MVAATYRFGVDWTRKGFVCWGAAVGDALNIIPSPLSWELTNYSTAGSATSVTKSAEATDYGTNKLRCVTGTAVNAGLAFGSSGGTDTVPASASTQYTAVVWVKGITAYAGVNFRLAAYDQGDNQLAVSGNVTLTASWQRVTLAFSTGVGDTHAYLTIAKNNNATDVTFDATGFMIVAGATAPQGFNAGSAYDRYDNVSALVIDAHWSVGFRSPFEDVADENSCSITLRNTDKRFSPEYSSGGLYDAQWLLRPVTIEATYSSTTYTLWKGWTDNVEPRWNPRGERVATLSATGAKRFLQEAELMMELQENKRSDEVLTTIIDRVPFPQAAQPGPWALGVSGFSEVGSTTILRANGLSTSFEQGKSTFTYVGDTWGETKLKGRGFGTLGEARKPKGVNAYEAIASVVAAERGRFFLSRSGVATFWHRHHLITDLALDDTLTDAAQDMQYAYGDYLASRVNVNYYPRAITSGTEILWQLEAPIEVKANKDKTIRARFTEQASDGKVSAIEVVAPNRHDSSLVLSTRRVELASFKANATGAEITFRARRDGTVSAIIIRGRKITTYNQATVTEVKSGVQFNDGYREFTLDLDLLEDEDTARSIAQYEISRRGRAYGVVEQLSFLANKDATNMTRAMARMIGDRIRVVESQTGHDAHHFLIGEEHNYAEGARHSVTWYLEPAEASAFWMVGRAGYSELGSTTIVGPF